MSNYGMKTIKKNGDTAINMAWPIFGFPLDKRNTLFKTMKIVDAHKYAPPESMGLPKPTDNYFQDYKEKTIKTRILRYEHNLGFRPLGYTSIRANLSCVRRAQLVQDAGGNSMVGGDFTVEWREIEPYKNPQVLLPTPSLEGKTEAPDNFWIDCMEGDDPKYGPVVPRGVPSWFRGLFFGGLSNVSVNTEITDKYVDVYLSVLVGENIARAFSGDWDITQRVKTWLDLAGSTYEVSIFLTDMSLEDLL